MHVPRGVIEHTMAELVRICRQVVIITNYVHGVSDVKADHVFNHNYFQICTSLGRPMQDVWMHGNRIYFRLGMES